MEGARFILIRVINVIGAIIAIFLGLRIIFRFFSANPSAPIVAWIYNISGNLVYPFRGIFGDVFIGGTIDVSALIALLAYSVILSLLIAFINAIFRPIIIRRDTHAHVH